MTAPIDRRAEAERIIGEIGERTERWTAAEVAFIRAHYGAMTTADIGLALGKSGNACRLKARTLGIAVRLQAPPRPNAHTKALLAKVAQELGCTAKDLLSASQKHPFVAGRRRVARELRDGGYSFPNIGKQLGRDHSTIVSGLKILAAQYGFQKGAGE